MDHIIRCRVFFKDSSICPTIYEISKKDLQDSFIQYLHDFYGEDWRYFDTCFVDTNREAYGEFSNSDYRRKNTRIASTTLYKMRKKVNQLRWKEEKLAKREQFYLLFFENREFFKIGKTYQNFHIRLDAYLKARGTDIKYLGVKIDFKKSVVIRTNNCYSEIEILREKISLEEKVLKEFGKYRIDRSECLKKDCYESVFKYLSSYVQATESQIWTVEQVNLYK